MKRGGAFAPPLFALWARMTYRPYPECHYPPAMDCKCGCGHKVTGRRVFVDKEHQLEWMVAGGAKELNALVPIEAKSKGGRTAARNSVQDGRWAQARQLGPKRAMEIAAAFRQRTVNRPTEPPSYR
jgi:hypothetical protein